MTIKGVPSAPYNKLAVEYFCSMRPIKWKYGGWKVHVKFNMLDGPTEDVFVLPSADIDEDEYDFDYGSVRIYYTIPGEDTNKGTVDWKQKIVSEQEALKVPEFLINRIPKFAAMQFQRDRGTLNWHTVCFTFEMYRHPIPTLLVTSLPVLFLLVLAIAIYFE